MKIIWSNSGGELDSVVIKDLAGREADAVEGLVEMIRNCGELHPGDVITVVEDGDALGPLVERLHVNDPTAVERYKGFVIRTNGAGDGFTWDHCEPYHARLRSIEDTRADIDLFVAKVDVAR